MTALACMSRPDATGARTGPSLMGVSSHDEVRHSPASRLPTGPGLAATAGRAQSQPQPGQQLHLSGADDPAGPHPLITGQDLNSSAINNQAGHYAPRRPNASPVRWTGPGSAGSGPGSPASRRRARRRRRPAARPRGPSSPRGGVQETEQSGPVVATRYPPPWAKQRGGGCVGRPRLGEVDGQPERGPLAHAQQERPEDRRAQWREPHARQADSAHDHRGRDQHPLVPGPLREDRHQERGERVPRFISPSR